MAYFPWLIVAAQHQSSHSFYNMHDEGRTLKASKYACCLYMQANLKWYLSQAGLIMLRLPILHTKQQTSPKTNLQSVKCTLKYECYMYCRTAANPSNCQRNHIKAASQNKLGTMAVSAAGLCSFVRYASAQP